MCASPCEERTGGGGDAAEQDNRAADSLDKLATSVPQIRSVEASMARTADGLFENPGPVDEVVRDLEDSGYPVDGSTEEMIRQPDDLSVAAEVPEKSGQRSRGGHGLVSGG